VVVEAQTLTLGRITLRVQRDGRGFTVEVTPDGEGLVSHAGAALEDVSFAVELRRRFPG
jgi:DNA-binding transcriptional LysR family regulator